MTREEFDTAVSSTVSLALMYNYSQMYITSLEQRIAEISTPKTCEGCKYYDENIFYRKGNDCRECSRYMTDYYESKANS